MPEISNILGKPYKYRRCVMSDVGRHYEQIKQWIPEEESFQQRMADCIKDQNAWCTENTFLYYYNETPEIAHGVALFGLGYSQELLALFMGVFSQQDKVTHALKFKLHPGKLMEEYMALLTPTSMKRARSNPEHPVAVRIDKLRDKLFSIFKARGLDKR